MVNYTVCATIKLNGFYTAQCQGNIILQRGFLQTTGNYALIFQDTVSSCTPSTADTNAYTICAIAGNFTNGVPFYHWNYPYRLHSGGWYSVTITFNGAKTYTYINGAVVDSTSSSLGPTPLGTSTEGLYMGANYNNTTSSFPDWFKGLMDEVRVYNRVLGDSEIVQMHTNIVIPSPYPNNLCGGSFNLPYNLKDSITFVTGTVFTAQLSDAAGSFASPTNLGSVTVGANHPVNGTISCTLPASLVSGTGYRIRITTSNSQYPSSLPRFFSTMPVISNFSASSNTPICNSDTIRLFGNTTTPTGFTWAWTGPNGYSSTSQNNKIGAVTAAMAGNYILTATQISTGCSISDTETVVISTVPSKPVAGSNTPLCVGATLNLTSSSATAGVTYSWTGPNSFVSSTQNPNKTSVTTLDAGNYIVTASLAGCVSKDTAVVVINTIPSPPTAGSNSPVCLGSNINITASTIAGATYSWTGPSLYTSLQQNPTVLTAQPGNAGTYNVTATINGCTSAAAHVTVSTVQGPALLVYPNPGDSICVGRILKLNALLTNPGTSTYQWVKNGVNVTGATTTLLIDNSVSNGDTYKLILTPGAGSVCTTPFSSNSIAITVLPYVAPSVTVTTSADSMNWPGVLINFNALAVDAGKFPMYQWVLNGRNVLGALSSVWGATTLQNNDSICVLVTSTYRCPNPLTTSACRKIAVATGINKLGDAVVNIYPNPVGDQLMIEGAATGTQVQLKDIRGKVVYQGSMGATLTKINTTQLAAGTYVLVLTADNGKSLTRKIVKE